MPPKAANARKEKLIEDKTFGLKNKNKSKKVQQYVNQVKSSVVAMGNRKDRQMQEKANAEKALKKKMEEEKKKEMQELFQQVVIQQKVPFGVVFYI